MLMQLWKMIRNDAQRAGYMRTVASVTREMYKRHKYPQLYNVAVLATAQRHRAIDRVGILSYRKRLVTNRIRMEKAILSAI